MTSAVRVFIEGKPLTYAQIGERLNIGNSAAYNRVLRLRSNQTPLTWANLGERVPQAGGAAPEPITWTARIQSAIAKASTPQSLDDVVAAIDDGSMERAKLAALTSTLLSQLSTRGKLARSGAYRDFRYAITDITLVDGRHRARGQQPSERTKQAPKPKKAPAPAKAKKPAAPPVAPQRVPITRVRVTAPERSPKGEPETVEQFLKRGGRIQKLKPGESSTPLFESVRAMNDRTMRKRLSAEPDNDLIDDDEAVAA